MKLGYRKQAKDSKQNMPMSPKFSTNQQLDTTVKQRCILFTVLKIVVFLEFKKFLKIPANILCLPFWPLALTLIHYKGNVIRVEEAQQQQH